MQSIMAGISWPNYNNEGVSGAKGRDKRPELSKLLTAVNRREIDIIMTWSVDRLGRFLQHLIGFLSDIQAKAADLYLHQQNIDTNTPSGKAMFQMAGVFAEFERSIIHERSKAQQGKILGRPKIPV